MSWKIIRPQIKALLDKVDALQEVSKSPKIKFNGYPAAHVVPSENTGDYETTTENIRTYSFVVRVFYETKQTDIEDAMVALEEVVDTVIDLFDQEDLKGGDTRTIGVGLDAGHQFINIFASPGRWGVIEEDQLIMAEIILKVRISVDIT